MNSKKIVVTTEQIWESKIKDTKYADWTIDTHNWCTLFKNGENKVELYYDPVLNDLGRSMAHDAVKAVPIFEDCLFVYQFICECKKMIVPECAPSPLPYILDVFFEKEMSTLTKK